MKIIFTDIRYPNGSLPIPKPASEYLPQWYKDAKPYLNSKKSPRVNDGFNSTIKNCMPIFDMMTAGYILETPSDIYIRQTPEGPFFTWGLSDTIQFQKPDQFQNHPYAKNINYAARINIPWSIKTPSGWSIMVMEPQHQEPGPFECLSGIIDTDKYSIPFNMFLKLRDSKFEGLVPAGTPLLQIIPFKRENWKAEIGKEKEHKKFISDCAKINRVFFDRYKKFWWNKKEYK
jgi:hypothetical protein